MSKTDTVLELLKKSPMYGVSNFDFVEKYHCHRFGSAIHDLRKQEYTIHTVQIKRGLFRYYLTDIDNTETITEPKRTLIDKILRRK